MINEEFESSFSGFPQRRPPYVHNPYENSDYSSNWNAQTAEGGGGGYDQRLNDARQPISYQTPNYREPIKSFSKKSNRR
jgi:hypothetical protein